MKWTLEDRQKIREYRDAGHSWEETGKKFGTTADGARNAIRSMPTTEEPVDHVARHRAKQDADAKRTELIDAVREVAFREYLSELVAQNVSPAPSVPRPKTAKSKHPREREALLNFNDWHYEERVKSAGVLDLNSYDIATACRRVYRIVQGVKDWKRDYEAAGRHVARRLRVGLLGDFLTGTLHGLERHSDAPNIVRAALACGDLIAMAIADLATEFDEIAVHGVVGNHGRLPDDRKVPTKDPTRSWDYLAYQVAKRRLVNEKRITWELPESYGVLFDMAGHTCFAGHGNFIANNLGIVGYGVRRFASGLASNLGAAGKQLKYCFFGHWHQSSAAEFAGVETFICPSLIGTQEYSFLSGGSVNRPAQELFVFDEDLGYVTKERFYGEGPGYSGTYELEV